MDRLIISALEFICVFTDLNTGAFPRFLVGEGPPTSNEGTFRRKRMRKRKNWVLWGAHPRSANGMSIRPISLLFNYTYSSRSSDPGGSGPPYPCYNLSKKDGHCTGPQVSRIIGPPSVKFLDPLLTNTVMFSVKKQATFLTQMTLLFQQNVISKSIQNSRGFWKYKFYWQARLG